MNRLIIIVISILFLNHCSLNESSRIWKDKEKKIENQKNIKKIFTEVRKITSEFNQELELDLGKIKKNNKIVDNKNNYGSQDYSGSINTIGKYKFSKLENINRLEFKPIFLDEGIIFFDKKGSIIKYNNDQKILWKKNYYSKSEKKLQPKLNFFLDNKSLIITDSISKYYSININSGELNWSKNNIYPFNSEIKKKIIKFLL